MKHEGVTVQLEDPIRVDGREVSEIRLRAMTPRHVLALNVHRHRLRRQALLCLALLSSYSERTLRKLSRRDANRLVEVMTGMMEKLCEQLPT